VRYQNIPKIKKIRALLEEDKEPVICKVFYGSHEECLEEEKRLIKNIGRKPHGPLLNLTDGGDGTAGFNHSPETRKLFSKQRKGKAVTHHTEEWKQRLREDNKGGKATRKKVCKFDLEGNLIETFESMIAAARSVDMTKNNFAFWVVRDGSIPRDGHFYRYEGSDDIIPSGIKDAERLIARREQHKRSALAGKRVKKLMGDNEIIYESIKEASRHHPEIKYATLWASLKYGRTCAGARWVYC